MTVRFDAGVLGAVLLSAGVACAALHAAEWKPAELVTFTDFDNLEVKLDGMKHKAFLVGLRPISENGQGMARQQVTRKAVEEELKKSELFAQVVTRRGEVLGLSIDAFAHHKHGFEHAWNPSKYPYCWSGWGAYNFNTYFLCKGTTTFEDNFGENKLWRASFAEVLEKLKAKEQDQTKPSSATDRPRE